jgi:DNA-binding transcriptional regulator YdaS (Cro superfamily)
MVLTVRLPNGIVFLMNKLLAYLNSLDQPAQKAFAEACGTTVGYLRKAISINQLLSAAVCVAIERETNRFVSRQDLRSDDWEAIWPELKNNEAA